MKYYFDKYKMKNQYQTVRNYVELRCSKLPGIIVRKYHNLEACHIASTSYGMSNYIELRRVDTHESVHIRISDHDPTGSGSPCDYYLYINNEYWQDIKKQVLKIAEVLSRKGV